ncbi:lipoyl(octanoyl) transferase LipB [Ectothiorhodospira mobilis]|uniref:lipoyl(octanoyl) transferase LipB n=1 Tax=Ectothiorhodospira mobilis TaxID=195064 RepID=UPI001EE7A2D9|nr:lipoyl(octanoyl) transferase LipB [Ectothiorhodospira mobilis]MCG5536263.1 lipoyl(octanoyl) transferase LipB [Ectothiorhodospira mobilis]
MHDDPGALRVRRLGRADYLPVWRRMQAFNQERGAATADELWQVEHPPVFTLGLNGRREHLLDPGDIPVLAVDRGGQVTYHGPGQVVLYLLLDLRRQGLGVRALVTALEHAVIDYLAGWGIAAQARADAPGVYVDGAKIAALGLRVRRGGSYHGLAFNLDPDLSAFERINPCGHRGLVTTSLAALVGHPPPWSEVADALTACLAARLGRILAWEGGGARRDGSLGL